MESEDSHGAHRRLHAAKKKTQQEKRRWSWHGPPEEKSRSLSSLRYTEVSSAWDSGTERGPRETPCVTSLVSTGRHLEDGEPISTGNHLEDSELTSDRWPVLTDNDAEWDPPDIIKRHKEPATANAPGCTSVTECLTSSAVTRSLLSQLIRLLQLLMQPRAPSPSQAATWSLREPQVHASRSAKRKLSKTPRNL